VKTTKEDTHMQLGDISWKVGFNHTVWVNRAMNRIYNDIAHHEKGNMNSTVISNGPFTVNLGNDTYNVSIDSYSSDLVPGLRCTSSALQDDGEFATGLIQCQVEYEGQEPEQRNCFVNPREIASLTPNEHGTLALDQFELLCPLKQYATLDDWKSQNMDA
jgi:hypothetical protein